MTESDRVRWNKRYSEGAYASRTHPSDLLADWIEQLPCPSVLDVACGRGRNSIFLAEHGFNVLGVDISDVAIGHATENAVHLNEIEFMVADLDDGLQLNRTFDLIVMVRFVQFELLKQLPQLLNQEGCIVVEEHLQWDDPDVELAGPSSPRFRVAPGQIAETLSDFETLHSYEGLLVDPLGETSAVSQFIGRKR